MKSTQIKNKLNPKRIAEKKVEKPDLAIQAISNNLAQTNDKLVQETDQINISLKIDNCFLKSQNQSFKQFEIRLEDDTLNFHRQSKSSNGNESKYSNSLLGVHIISDARPVQCPKTGDVYHSLALLLPTDTARVIYFKS